MHYENELRFFCNTLKKCRIKVSFAELNDPVNNVLDDTVNVIFSGSEQEQPTIGNFLQIRPYTIYKLTSSFKLCYIFLLLPGVSSEQIMAIGPYLSEAVDTKSVFEIGEKYGISPQKQKLLQDYYSNLAVETDSSRIHIMLYAFGEHIWGGSSGFTVVDINRELLSDISVLSRNPSKEDAESLMVNMELMQKRYDFENELIRAVTLGQEHRASQIMERISEVSFERRVSDPIRNLKNYCIIMNTLLRKAAENGGVHPIHLDNVSSDFAKKIENIHSTDIVPDFMLEMLKRYCRLVRKHSLKNYSPLVQKAILKIESDLTCDLSLKEMAKLSNVSSGYFSGLFRKETGQTLTQYVNSKRIDLAKHLLKNTSLQVQTIAQHCGVLDFHYFCRMFKNAVGKTPTEYRDIRQVRV